MSKFPNATEKSIEHSKDTMSDKVSNKNLSIVHKIILTGLTGIILTLVPALFSDDYPNSMDAAFNVPLLFALAFVIGGWMAYSTPREELKFGSTIALGASLMLFYPVWGFIDALFHPAAHTFLGLEVFVYATFGLICGVVALLGHILVVQPIGRKFNKGKTKEDTR